MFQLFVEQKWRFPRNYFHQCYWVLRLSSSSSIMTNCGRKVLIDCQFIKLTLNNIDDKIFLLLFRRWTTYQVDNSIFLSARRVFSVLCRRAAHRQWSWSINLLERKIFSSSFWMRNDDRMQMENVVDYASKLLRLDSFKVAQ